MKKFVIRVQERHDLGKGASRRLRRQDLVPGIVYGGEAAPMSVETSHRELALLLEDPAVVSSMLEMVWGQQRQLVVLRDLQRHPYKARIMHFDLQRVNSKEEIVMRVPLQFINSELAPGVKVSKGMISHLMTSVEISCLPNRLPEYLVVDLAKLELNQTIRLNQLSLPEGVKLASFEDPTAIMVTIHLAKGNQMEEETTSTESVEVPVAAKGKEATAG